MRSVGPVIHVFGPKEPIGTSLDADESWCVEGKDSFAVYHRVCKVSADGRVFCLECGKRDDSPKEA